MTLPFARLSLLALLIGLALPLASAQETSFDPELYAPHNPNSRQDIDYTPLDRFLEAFADEGRREVRLRYDMAEKTARGFPIQVIAYFRQVPVDQFSRDQQLALWLNLYMFESIRKVLAAWPIKDVEPLVRGAMDEGWDRPTMLVKGVRLSLRHIETILATHWGDPRILYGFAIPARDAPRFPDKAYRADSVWTVLDEKARDYINSRDGLRVRGSTVQVSPAILRVRDLFFEDDAALLAHLKQHAEPKLKAKLDQVTAIEERRFSWRVNEKRTPQRNIDQFGGAAGGGGGGGFGS